MSVAETFQVLVRRWKRATRFSSSVTDMATEPSYQRIIGLGPEAIPLILRELEREPDHWFWALRAITGLDVVPQTDMDKLGKMRAAWLEWGETHGHLRGGTDQECIKLQVCHMSRGNFETRVAVKGSDLMYEHENDQFYVNELFCAHTHETQEAADACCQKLADAFKNVVVIPYEKKT